MAWPPVISILSLSVVGFIMIISVVVEPDPSQTVLNRLLFRLVSTL